jgi:hypothetical protein
MLERMQATIGTLWCTVVHNSPMWPIYGMYECRTCGRRYPAFAEAPVALQATSAVKRPRSVRYYMP